MYVLEMVMISVLPCPSYSETMLASVYCTSLPSGWVGADVGAVVGVEVGSEVNVGTVDGIDVGAEVGAEVGPEVGVDVSEDIGAAVGVEVSELCTSISHFVAGTQAWYVETVVRAKHTVKCPTAVNVHETDIWVGLTIVPTCESVPAARAPSQSEPDATTLA